MANKNKKNNKSVKAEELEVKDVDQVEETEEVDEVEDQDDTDSLVEEHEKAQASKASSEAKLAKTNAALEKKAKTLQAETAAATKEKINAEEKVMFMIPVGIGEQPGGYDEVQINGHVWRVKKGEYVEIPRSVANQLANYYNVQLNAGSDMLANRNETTQNALEA